MGAPVRLPLLLACACRVLSWSAARGVEEATDSLAGALLQADECEGGPERGDCGLSLRHVRAQKAEARPAGAAASRGPQVACGPWCFLDSYPRQYVAQRLGDGQTIAVDGDLSDPAWAEVPFSGDEWVDIAQPLYPDFRLPAAYDTRLKARWDSEYLYLAVELGEPFVTGVVTGHNPTLQSPNPLGSSYVPYYDNDFEVFVDVSGTNYFYKEFEMNFLNATYDVFWHVPDGTVPCNGDILSSDWCVNTSAKVYPGTWSMWPRLQTATKRTPRGWAAELAMPLRAQGAAGGLLDGGAGWERFDPNSGARYWLVDFARAEHPFFTGSASLLGPLCGEVLKSNPTLLGTDQWSCYYEYVWQAVGGHRYMHNPDSWGFMEFAPAPPSSAAAAAPPEPCLRVDWPARYILSQVWEVEVAFATNTGTFTAELLPLLPKVCTAKTSCNSTALTQALTTFSRDFNLVVRVDNSATRCVDYKKKNYTGGPCFEAEVSMQLPGGPLVQGTIREDRYLNVTVVADSPGPLPCLADAATALSSPQAGK